MPRLGVRPAAKLTRCDYLACAGHQVSIAQEAIVARQGLPGQEAGLQGRRLHDDHRDDNPSDIRQQFQTQRHRDMVKPPPLPPDCRLDTLSADHSKADLAAALQGRGVYAIQLQRGTHGGGRSAADTAQDSATHGRERSSLCPNACLGLHDDRQSATCRQVQVMRFLWPLADLPDQSRHGDALHPADCRRHKCDSRDDPRRATDGRGGAPSQKHGMHLRTCSPSSSAPTYRTLLMSADFKRCHPDTCSTTHRGHWSKKKKATLIMRCSSRYAIRLSYT